MINESIISITQNIQNLIMEKKEDKNSYNMIDITK